MADTSPSRIPCFSKHSIGLAFPRQQGMTLIMLVFIVGLAATAYLVRALNSNMVKVERDRKTSAAMAEAKTALIGWSASHATMPGALPCPDTANTGSSGSCTATAGLIGRLPWKTLGLSDLRDGHGECLWYAISPIYRNTITVANRASSPINSGIPGTITIKQADGTNLANPVIAVIIAPGPTLTGQDRSKAGTTVCGGNTTASNYLDSALSVNNATGNVSGSNYIFVAGTSSDTFNDRLNYLTADEFYRTVRKRLVTEILGNATTHAGPVRYFDAGGTYPCPASTINGGQDCPSLPSAHYINNSGMGLQYAALGSWLTNNGWFPLANYSYTDATHVKMTLADTFGSYSCDANSSNFTCASP
jgi:type II secretory pathway pseudopilin PulG